MVRSKSALVKRAGAIRTVRETEGIGGLPVQFGGVVFTPGLRLVADEDGVVVLPPGLTESDISVDETVASTAAYTAGPGNA